MKRLLLAVLLATLCAGISSAETLRERYWRLHRERNPTTRYGAPPTVGTNSIPAGYRLIEYVESTGSQYVDTGIQIGDITAISFSAVFQTGSSMYFMGSTKRNGSSSAQRERLFGAATSDGTAITAGYIDRGNVSGARLTLSSVASGAAVDTGKRTTSVPGITQTFSFFRAKNDSDKIAGTAGKLRLSSLLLWGSADTLVRDYIPVTDTNGVAGLWDRVSGTMFYSATSTPLVAGPELRPATVLPTVSRETVREMLAPAPTGEPPELAGGDLWLDCLAIPEGNWLCECPIAGTTNTAWRAALCPSNILRAVVWRHAVGTAPTNLPVTLEHDPSRVIGRIERLYYESGTGVVARISVTQAGYAWAVSNHCAKPSPDIRAMFTNLIVRTDGWIHEHQDYIDARCVPRGEDMSSVTNVPSGVQALVMAPVYLRGLSLVHQPLLPTYIEYRVPDHLRDVYPIRPPRQWTWRNGD